MSPMSDRYPEIAEMVGKSFVRVVNDGDSVTFKAEDGSGYRFQHDQDSRVKVEDVVGDLNDLVGAPLLVAEEVVHRGEDGDDSWTWTFYRFQTIKGSATIRWYGESNGYYSESVDLVRL
jgi:hypothetical protein